MILGFSRVSVFVKLTRKFIPQYGIYNCKRSIRKWCFQILVEPISLSDLQLISYFDVVLLSECDEVVLCHFVLGVITTSGLVLVSNKNIYINIKPYFYLLYRSILKCQVMDVFRESFQTLSQVLVISRNVNRYGVSALAVCEMRQK